MRTLSLVVVLAAVALNAQSLPPQRNGSLPGPFPLLPADNWWNQDVSLAPVDARSAQFIAFINNGGTRRLHPDFGGYQEPGSQNIYGFPYVVVSADQPKVAVQFQYDDESDGVNHDTGQSFPFYPIPEEAKTQPYWIEGGPPGHANVGGDRHMLIVDRDHKHLYELFALEWNGSQWIAGSGAFFDLNANTRRPEEWTSADAAGLAILPGLVRYDEVFGSGEIRHALRVTVRATNGYVWPASHRAGSNPSALPMGARLRLKPTVNLSGFPPEVQKIFRAMQRYGLIVADNGSDMYIGGAFDPRWNNDVLNPAFRSLSANDFEVIQLGWRGAPCEAPGQPRSLSSTVTGQLVQLDWLAPDAGPAPLGYLLEAGTAWGLANIATFPLTASSFAVMAPAGTYHVRVRAGSACGLSAPSNDIVVNVAGCSPPPAPTFFRFTRSGSLVTLNWNAVPGAGDYVIEVGSAPGLRNLLVVGVPGGPIAASAPPGPYFARVRARNGCGVGSASNEIVVEL